MSWRTSPIPSPSPVEMTQSLLLRQGRQRGVAVPLEEEAEGCDHRRVVVRDQDHGVIRSAGPRRAAPGRPWRWGRGRRASREDRWPPWRRPSPPANTSGRMKPTRSRIGIWTTNNAPSSDPEAREDDLLEEHLPVDRRAGGSRRPPQPHLAGALEQILPQHPEQAEGHHEEQEEGHDAPGDERGQELPERGLRAPR